MASHDLPTSVRLPRDLRSELVRVCKEQGCSTSFLIVDVLRKWVAWKRQKEKTDAFGER